MTSAAVTFRTRVQSYHQWRQSTGWLTRLLLVAGWACVMGLLAQARFPLPFTPVPITMQVFGVVLGVALLGPLHGGLAQMVYVLVGILGVPWFQGYNGGVAYFFGATGGYLLAYPVAAWVLGVIIMSGKRTMLRFQVASYTGLFIIYALGMLWLATAIDVPLSRAFALGVAPFILVDAVKIAVAAAVARPFAWR